MSKEGFEFLQTNARLEKFVPPMLRRSDLVPPGSGIKNEQIQEGATGIKTMTLGLFTAEELTVLSPKVRVMTKPSEYEPMIHPNWKNRTLFIADNLRVLRGMDSGTVDLIATDPPFNTKRLHNAPLGSRTAQQKFDDRWRWDEVTDDWHDVIAADHPAIKEIIEAAAVIEGGSIDPQTGKVSTGRILNSIAAYLTYMAPRIVEMRRILKPEGVLFMQCDNEANSYLRLLLDAIFGRKNLINMVVRRRATSKGLATRRLPNNHDTLLVYGVKAGKWKWNPPYEPYDENNLDEKTLKQYDRMDPFGRRYELADLTNPSKSRPNLTYEFLGVNRVWRWTEERMKVEYKAGRIEQTAPGNVPRLIRYLDEQCGKKCDDLWLDMFSVESNDSDWGTRKPVSLYQRIIECATNRGDVVFDPFCGCATTCVAAEMTDRQWVGIDIDPVAESETEKRLFSETQLRDGDISVKVRKGPPRRTDLPFVSGDKLRDALWKNQDRKCANPYCDSGKLRKADLELDHRIPASRGGADDVINRIGLCSNCNRRKSVKAWGLFLDEERQKQPHVFDYSVLRKIEEERAKNPSLFE